MSRTGSNHWLTSVLRSPGCGRPINVKCKLMRTAPEKHGKEMLDEINPHEEIITTNTE